MMAAAPLRPAPPQTTRLRLTLACWDYDRTRALLENRVALDGIELTYLNLVIEETFFRMARYHEFDASEMSLSSYVVSLFADKPQFIAIPVFPLRSFRHSGIYINANSGIREPKDLIGKRVGCAESTDRQCVDPRHIERRIQGADLKRHHVYRRPGRAWT